MTTKNKLLKITIALNTKTYSIEIKEHTILKETTSTIFFDTTNTKEVNPLTKLLIANIDKVKSTENLEGINLSIWCYPEAKEVSLHMLFKTIEVYLETYASNLTALADKFVDLGKAFIATVKGDPTNE